VQRHDARGVFPARTPITSRAAAASHDQLEYPVDSAAGQALEFCAQIGTGGSAYPQAPATLGQSLKVKVKQPDAPLPHPHGLE
jgi:hypothetical protein